MSEGFDDPSFDSVEYINGRFPNEESLESLDRCIESLHVEIRHVDAEILDAVRRQSQSGRDAREALHAAHVTIHEAMEQIVAMKQMSAESQGMVEEVCKDIRQLDTAKKNLSVAIAALRRLAMLVDAVDQLQVAAEQRDFRNAGNLMGAVKQLYGYFESYTNIAKIAELRGRIYALEKSLRTASLREFELLGEDVPPPQVLESLKACCVVTGAIGNSARDELIDIICRREMSMYTQIFGTVGETAKLERTVNRFKWFIRRLDGRRAIWGIFPEEWRVTQLLAVTFCSITKSELAEILGGMEGRIDVEGLLKAVEATHVFEEEMARRFDTLDEYQEEEEEDDQEGNSFLTSEENERIKRHSKTSTDAIRKKYASHVTNQERKRALMEDAAAAAVKHAVFKNSISPVFQPYMYAYIDDITETLSKRLESFVGSETWMQMSDDQPIFRSSDSITSMVREELKHCSAKLSRGETLVELGKTFRKMYQSYADMLMAKLPKTANGATAAVAVVGNTSWHITLTEESIRLICLMISTCDHCILMIQQLENALVKRLDPEFKDSVDFSEAEDAFNNVITQSLSVMLLGIETQMDVTLATLMRKNWQAFDMTGDQSDFAQTACSVLRNLGPQIWPPRLSQLYFNFFCDKLIRSFAPRLFDAVFKCGPISQAGGQQLRLDLEALRSAFITLAKEGSVTQAAHQDIEDYMEGVTGKSKQSSHKAKSWVEGFVMDVTTALGTTEAVLKVVVSPIDTVVDTFVEIMPGASQVDLQHILELMGVRKSDMVNVLEDFAKKTSSRQDQSSQPVIKPLPAPTFGQQTPTSSPFSLPPGAAAKASAAAQDMASHISRIRSTANARFSAVAASDSMRETMGRTLGAMKSLRFNSTPNQKE
ncbi:Vacuolar protein sorting-associated protein 53 A [Picochlorum sp. SENEW3]|nr:Vacuolar protein sorting-associated protein 53 A [Picochlorum sp. SENEW3]